jgi:hypothetical protein
MQTRLILSRGSILFIPELGKVLGNYKLHTVELQFIVLITPNGDSFPGVKPPGREADHSPPSSVEANNAWRYTSTPHTSSWLGS